MSTTLRFQRTHSRNSHDWRFEQTTDGRLTFIENHGGVKKRVGMIVTALGKYDELTNAGITEYLNANFHTSYTVNDNSAPLRQLIGAGMVQRNGWYYSLTPNGKKMWQDATKKWVGQKLLDSSHHPTVCKHLSE